MKDLVFYSLDVNIPMQNNTAEKKLFNYVVEAIDYYLLVQSFTQTKLIFLWLMQLNLLVNLATELNCIKSKSFNNNCDKNNSNMSNEMGDKELMTKKELKTEKELGMENLESCK